MSLLGLWFAIISNVIALISAQAPTESEWSTSCGVSIRLESSFQIHNFRSRQRQGNHLLVKSALRQDEVNR